MQIEDRGIIYDATKRAAVDRVAAFTSLYITASGAIFAGFHVGSAKHALGSTIRLSRSRDGGRTWRELPGKFEMNFKGVPGSLCGAELVEVRPGKLLLFCTWFDRHDPQRPLFDPVTEGILPSKLLVAESADEGESWGPWRDLPVGGLTGCACTGPAVQWSDGRIAYPFESYKQFDDLTPSRHGAWFIVSEDEGRTFGPPVQVAQHPEHKVFYWDQRLCAGRVPGEFFALFWTHDLEHRKDLNVHFRHGRADGKSFALDPILETSMPGQIAAPLLLPDGRLLAFVVNRSRPGTMTLWTSHDEGRTWPESLVVHVHDEKAMLSQGAENVDFVQYWDDMGKWSFGHPAIRYLGGQQVLVAFYAGAPSCLSIHWARVNVG